MYHRIVVPLDGSEQAERALPPAAVLAERFDATLILLRVTEPTAEPSALDAERQEADHYLAVLYDRLSSRGLSVHYQRPEGAPAASILEHACNQDADLIALTSHGYGSRRERALGSVAEAIVQMAACPVLVVAGDESAPA